jgi:thiamine-phosphate pyrophosphorylase
MMVTDRRRLAARTALADDADQATVRQVLLDQIAEAAQAGVDLVQLRERDLPTADLADLARRAMALAVGSQTRILVNDRVDVAIAARADGVHLPSRGLPPAGARELIAPPGLVGCSIHEPAPALQPSVVDYVVFGTVFPTASKPEGMAVAAIEGLQMAVAGSSVPVLAIGGVTLERIGPIAAAGAAGIAAIELFLPAAEPSVQASMKKTVESVHESFDSARDVS